MFQNKNQVLRLYRLAVSEFQNKSPVLLKVPHYPFFFRIIDYLVTQ